MSHRAGLSMGPHGQLHFKPLSRAAINAAAGRKFTAQQWVKLCALVNEFGAKRRDDQLTSDLRKRLAKHARNTVKSCRATADLLRAYDDASSALRVTELVEHLEYFAAVIEAQLREARDKAGGVLTPEDRQATACLGMAEDEYRRVMDLEAVPKGKPRDDVRWLIREVFAVCVEAGGVDSMAFLPRGGDTYEGAFLDLMQEILAQTDYEIERSKLAGLIIKLKLPATV